MPRESGDLAEHAAEAYLLAAGLELRERNYACRSGEIDLVMQDAEVLVFVEVRFRARDDYGDALDTVRSSKQRRLARAAANYLQRRVIDEDVACRFDVIGIGPERHHITWVRDAFDAPSDTA